MKLVLLPHRLLLAEVETLPQGALEAPFFALVQVDGHRSVVLPESLVPEGVNAEGPFRALAFVGPLPIEMIGVLGRVGSILAEVGVSIFAYSAFETDYILVRESYLQLAIRTLKEVNYEVETSPSDTLQ